MTTRIDLDDLPPKVAAQLTGTLQPGRGGALLVQNGVAVARLTAEALRGHRRRRAR